MPKVIQIRDVPDDVRDALAAAAAAKGLSLTRYVRGELERLARQQQVVRHNAEVIRRAQAEIGAHVDRRVILDVLREGRGE